MLAPGFMPGYFVLGFFSNPGVESGECSELVFQREDPHHVPDKARPKSGALVFAEVQSLAAHFTLSHDLVVLIECPMPPGIAIRLPAMRGPMSPGLMLPGRRRLSRPPRH